MKNNTLTLLNRVDARLAACAAMAVASTALTANTANADIVYSGTVNLNIASTTNGLYLNVVTGALNEPGNTGGSTVPSWDINIWSTGGVGLFSSATPAGGTYVVTAANFGANLAPGAVISAASLFGSGSSANNAQWNLNSSNNIIGFRFVDPSIGGGATVLYGWARISLGATAGGQPRMVVDYAYENTGASINAGQTAVPEPSTFALLGLVGLGGAGIRAWRKRKVA